MALRSDESGDTAPSSIDVAPSVMAAVVILERG
jgi:hypothetical protein